ncbi:MAG: HNH endonuclease, partial [Betaproteobacteria bacterium]|nr:HNH endonuclease [Betaproteobacteria bacterium]
MAKKSDKSAIPAWLFKPLAETPQGQKLREKVILRDGGRCITCNSKTRLEVHHRAYPPENGWAQKPENNLTTLCKLCHDIITDRIRKRRYAGRNPPEAKTILQPEKKPTWKSKQKSAAS